MINGRFTSLPSQGIVTDPRYWHTNAGYEFQADFGNVDLITVLSATNDGLSGYGWATTSLVAVDGTAGDLLDAADVTPTHILTDATGDTLASPRIFGSYSHALQASRFLGYMPTRLVMECYAAFTVNSAFENATFFGLAGPGTTAANGSGSCASVYANNGGGNFRLDSQSGGDNGATSDTAWHKWKIVVDATNTEWFIDDVSQGTITTEADDWPCSFKLIASTTNRIALSWVRIYYE